MKNILSIIFAVAFMFVLSENDVLAKTVTAPDGYEFVKVNPDGSIERLPEEPESVPGTPADDTMTPQGGTIDCFPNPNDICYCYSRSEIVINYGIQGPPPGGTVSETSSFQTAPTSSFPNPLEINNNSSEVK